MGVFGRHGSLEDFETLVGADINPLGRREDGHALENGQHVGGLVSQLDEQGVFRFVPLQVVIDSGVIGHQDVCPNEN